MSRNKAEAIISDAERQIHLMCWRVERGHLMSDRYSAQLRRKLLMRYFIERYC